MNKLAFARTINDMNQGLPKGRSTCFDFGSTFGCRSDCPVFMNNECDIQAENEESFKHDFED